MTRLRYVFPIITFFVVLSAACAAQNERVLYSFCPIVGSGCTDGAFPMAGVVLDAKGNIYGTTYGGGNPGCNFAGCGTVFELTQSGARPDGSWTETVLYSFNSVEGGSDGGNPKSGVNFDGQGNLYGTTYIGGLSNLGCDPFGCGVVFQLTPNGNGNWTEQVIYSFCSAANCSDGANPYGGLVFDQAGNLYGTTSGGGFYNSQQCKIAGCGTVFKLAKGANGIWSEQVLHEFNATNGASPMADLIFDAFGNLYGTTGLGGIHGYGTVFQLTPTDKGFWKEVVLHDFESADGQRPLAPLTLDATGNLYGTTFGGGLFPSICAPVGCGVAFELSPSAGGWNEQVLYYFCAQTNLQDKCSDGAGPQSNLVFREGKIYGTTLGGGSSLSPDGTVFELTPHGDGRWSETVLYSFDDFNGIGDGVNPQGNISFGHSGVLYGTTLAGGKSTGCNDGQACGTVFAVAP
jgi:hypothetical protein